MGPMFVPIAVVVLNRNGPIATSQSLMTKEKLRRLMELLVDKEEDEERIPDAGELEGSGDDFDG